MRDFTEGQEIITRYSTPHFPSQNPAEALIKTIAKTMKINHSNKGSEDTSLTEALITYRQTPHPATGIPPSNIMFCDGIKAGFPRKQSSE